MNQVKYMNAVLTVIAVCLILITFAVTGIIPSANAQENKRFATVPVNKDGTIDVWIRNKGFEVNVSKIAGVDLQSRAFPVIIVDTSKRR